MTSTLSQPNYNSLEAFGYTHPAAAEKFTTGSVLMGQTTGAPSFYVKTASGTPSGSIVFKCWGSDGSVKHTYGSYDATNLTSDWQLISPDTDISTYQTGLVSGDMIGLEFTEGSSSLYYHIAFSNTNQIDNAVYMDYVTSWIDRSPWDLGFSIEYDVPPTPTPSSSTVTIPPPVAMVNI
tara:strand:- start:399 stop:935 length:537 start_codon:yes stop_codon:yes gene_type:complete